jgi:hypothetical protein
MIWLTPNPAMAMKGAVNTKANPRNWHRVQKNDAAQRNIRPRWSGTTVWGHTAANLHRRSMEVTPVIGEVSPKG